MRPTPNNLIEKYRRVHQVLGASPIGSNFGYFEVNGMTIIASDGRCGTDEEGPETHWEHVSISLPKRIPTWTEMALVKELFWGDDETVVQYHPRKSDYVNNMPHCLHLWKKIGSAFELPPTECV